MKAGNEIKRFRMKPFSRGMSRPRTVQTKRRGGKEVAVGGDGQRDGKTDRTNN